MQKIQVNAWLNVTDKNLQNQNVDSIPKIEPSNNPFILNGAKNQPNDNNLPQVQAKSSNLNEVYERKEFERHVIYFWKVEEVRENLKDT